MRTHWSPAPSRSPMDASVGRRGRRTLRLLDPKRGSQGRKINRHCGNAHCNDLAIRIAAAGLRANSRVTAQASGNWGAAVVRATDCVGRVLTRTDGARLQWVRSIVVLERSFAEAVRQIELGDCASNRASVGFHEIACPGTVACLIQKVRGTRGL